MNTHSSERTSNPRRLDRGLATLLADPERAGQERTIRTQADWTRLAREAEHKGLAGLFDEQTRTVGVRLSAMMRDRIEEQKLRIAGGNLQLLDHTERLAHRFQQADLDLMLLKGAALQQMIYHRPDLRPMSDLDLLVRPNQVREACDLLEASGYHPGKNLLREDFFPRFYPETEFLHDGPGEVRIDLHVRPLRPMRYCRLMPEDAMWTEAKRIRIGQAGVFVPGDEDMLIHLSAHAAVHGNRRLLWLYDIKRFIETRGAELNWQRFETLTKEYRLSLPVRVALEQTEEWFGPTVPAYILASLAGHPESWRDRLVLRHAPHDAEHPVRHVAVNALCTPGLRYRLSYLKAVLVPGPDHIAELYPRRHTGWLLCGHAYRLTRPLLRAGQQMLEKLRGLRHRPADSVSLRHA